MLIWERDSAEIAARIRTTPQDFRIILKTKDETRFLKDWVIHHRRIVGEDGLIIFDNGSTAPEVLDYYRSIEDRVLVVRFSGYMNNLHRPSLVPELYGALRDSTRYFTFIDTDEFLYWFTASGACLSGQGFLSCLLARDELAIPGIWLTNVDGYRTRLWLNDVQHPLFSGIRSGKPVLSSRLRWDGMSNHNFQLPIDTWNGCATGNLVVAHLSRLDSQQRIRANLEKLRSYRFMSGDFTLDDILGCDPARLEASIEQYVLEIRSHTEEPLQEPAPGAPLPSGAIEISDGRVVFPEPEEEDLFRAFLHHPAQLIRGVLQGITESHQAYRRTA